MKKIIFVLSVLATLFAEAAFVPAIFANEADKKIVFYAFDVGQGDSLFFELPDGETVLIDGGARDAGASVVENLRSLGVKKIDLLIATHPHEDHIGGLIDVMNNFQIGEIWDSGYNLGTAAQRHFLETALKKKIPLSVTKAGFSRNIGEVLFSVLAPTRSLKTQNSDANNNCLIISVSWRNSSFLLMGDAEIEEQKTVPNFPHAQVLKLSHHGSSNGTNQFLLRKVRPQIAVASFASGNSYGHPHKKVLKLLEENKIPFYSTDNGNIVVTSDGNKFSVRYEKTSNGGILNFIKKFLGR